MSYWLYTKYMYFHFRCDDMGFDLVSNLFKRIAIQEMMHVEQLAERILFLKGEVEMKVAGEVSHRIYGHTHRMVHLRTLQILQVLAWKGGSCRQMDTLVPAIRQTSTNK